MNDPYKLLYFGILHTLLFGSIYLYGRKAFPKRAAILAGGTWLAMFVVGYFSGTATALLDMVLFLVYLFVLRRPKGIKELQQFYTDNKIYLSTKECKAALDILGNKNWSFAEGKLQKNINETTSYLFWRGYTVTSVSTGQYSRGNAYTYYLAFIFPPNSVSEILKRRALEAADKSTYTFKQRIKYFFNRDMDKPCLVKTAADGSFIIQYYTEPYAEQYAKQLGWIKENYGKLYFATATMPSFN